MTMKSICSFLFLLISASAGAQHLTFEEWSKQMLVDIRLRPRYGDAPKNAAQQASDAEFVRTVLATDSTPRAASKHLLELGFQLLREGDFTRSMYRFNQAYLIDASNTDVYWGFGSFFMELDKPDLAHTMYRAGLSVDSTNANLLNGEATAYLAERAMVVRTDSTQADELAEKALQMAQRAVRHKPAHQEAWQRVMICQFYLGRCTDAAATLEECIRVAGPSAPANGIRELLANCKGR
jgi:tetratricopeptide (TPR) repeat protein